jgi:hypothetical protein
MYSSSIVNKFGGNDSVSNDKLVMANEAFMDRNKGTLAFRGNDPFGS